MTVHQQVRASAWVSANFAYPCGIAGLLKEAIEDLEWAAAGGHQAQRGHVSLFLKAANPRALSLRATGAGALEVLFLRALAHISSDILETCCQASRSGTWRYNPSRGGLRVSGEARLEWSAAWTDR